MITSTARGPTSLSTNVAPASDYPIGSSQCTGGNMDLTDAGPGATVYLPVQVPGALLSIGDLHAVSLDGPLRARTCIPGREP